MMEFSFKIQINATKEKVWGFYSDIEKWYVWEKNLKNITLDHGFKTGSGGIMEFNGMPPMKYSLTLVTDQQEFWNKSETPFGSICFGHEITEEANGAVCVKHTARLESDSVTDEKVGFLKQVFSDVPATVMLLKKTVEAL